MNYRSVCLAAELIAALFGLAFLLAPAPLSALYGVDASAAGTQALARYFGIALLNLALLVHALRHIGEPALQRGIAAAQRLACVLAAALSVYLVLSGAINALGWSTVALYAVFGLLWGKVSSSAGPAAQPA